MDGITNEGHTVDLTKSSQEINAILVEVMFVPHDYGVVILHVWGEGTKEMIIYVQEGFAIGNNFPCGGIVDGAPFQSC